MSDILRKLSPREEISVKDVISHAADGRLDNYYLTCELFA